MSRSSSMRVATESRIEVAAPVEMTPPAGPRVPSRAASGARRRGGSSLVSASPRAAGVLQVAIGDHARQILSGHGDDEGGGPRGDHQGVVRRAAAVRIHHAVLAVDADDRLAEPAIDLVGGIPGVVMGDDLLIGLFARQHRRQHQPIIVAARFRVEQGHVPGIGRGVEQLFQHPARGHSGADDDKFLLHGWLP